jgi:hypothetical protein
MALQEALTAGSHDRAEIALGRSHRSPLMRWQ